MNHFNFLLFMISCEILILFPSSFIFFCSLSFFIFPAFIRDLCGQDSEICSLEATTCGQADRFHGNPP